MMNYKGRDLYGDGIKALNENRYSEAEQCFAELINVLHHKFNSTDRGPDQRLYLLLAQSRMAQRNYAGAEEAFFEGLEAEEAEGALFDILRQLTNVCTLQGKLDAADDWAKKADQLSQSPKEKALIQYLRGVNLEGRIAALVSEGLTEETHLVKEAHAKEALQLYHDAGIHLKEDQHYPSLLMRIGYCSQCLDRMQDAKEHYDKGLAMMQERLGPHHPNVATAIQNLGTFFLQVAAFDQALESFRQALIIRRRFVGEDNPLAMESKNGIELVQKFQASKNREERAGIVSDYRLCRQCGAVRPRKAISRCSTCLQVYYCNRECQTKHWQAHKLVCKKP